MKQAFFYDMVLGRVGIAQQDGAVTDVFMSGDQIPPDVEIQETPLLLQAANELKEYFQGLRKEFSVPLRPEGTAFQIKVWEALLQIPYGQTWTYGQLARAVGNPKASRAVGMANHRNPIMILIPCHRVIGSNGSLVGYGGGLPMKEALLKLEKSGA